MIILPSVSFKLFRRSPDIMSSPNPIEKLYYTNGLPRCPLRDLSHECWSYLDIAPNQRLKTPEIALYGVLFACIMSMFISLFHESAHAIAILAYGGEVIRIVIWPVTIFFDGPSSGGYVYYDGDFTPMQEFVICIAGTLGVIVVAITLLFIAWYVRLRPVINLFIIVYFLNATGELILYPLFDMANIQLHFATDFYGDWQRATEIFPWTRIIMYVVIIFFVTGTIMILRRGLSRQQLL